MLMIIGCVTLCIAFAALPALAGQAAGAALKQKPETPRR